MPPTELQIYRHGHLSMQRKLRSDQFHLHVLTIASRRLPVNISQHGLSQSGNCRGNTGDNSCNAIPTKVLSDSIQGVEVLHGSSTYPARSAFLEETSSAGLQSYTARDPETQISTHWEVTSPTQRSDSVRSTSRTVNVKRIRESSSRSK